MEYKNIKSNVNEYLKSNYSDDLKNIYNSKNSKDKILDATKEYLTNVDYEVDVQETASLVYNELFGLGKIEQILEDESITDISFNGNELWLQSNLFGRKKYEKSFSQQEAYILIEKISLVSQRPFNIVNPILDVEYDLLRINAIHESISKQGRSFSIRVLKANNVINKDNFPAPEDIFSFLCKSVRERKNIIISGVTGSGKSELQKFLIGKTEPNDKIVLISDNDELKINKLYPEKDIYTWITRGEFSSDVNIDFTKLIKPALRYNPEWLIIGESRGEEAFDMLNAATTGHSIITTLHSKSAKEIPLRLLNMCSESQKKINEKTLLNNIYQVIDIGIHMDTYFTDEGLIRRYIKQICLYSKEKGEFITDEIYSKEIT